MRRKLNISVALIAFMGNVSFSVANLRKKIWRIYLVFYFFPFKMHLRRKDLSLLNTQKIEKKTLCACY